MSDVFECVRTKAELVELLEANGSVQLVGGGTLRRPRPRPNTVFIDTARSRPFTESSKTSLGAGLRLLDVASVGGRNRSLRDAVTSIGGPEVWCRATLGGNLAGNGPRCMATPLVALNARVLVLTVKSGRAAENVHTLADWLGCDSGGVVLAAILPSGWEDASGSFVSFSCPGSAGHKLFSAAVAVGATGYRRTVAVAIGGRSAPVQYIAYSLGTAEASAVWWRRARPELFAGPEPILKLRTVEGFDRRFLQAAALETIERALRQVGAIH